MLWLLLPKNALRMFSLLQLGCKVSVRTTAHVRRAANIDAPAMLISLSLKEFDSEYDVSV